MLDGLWSFPCNSLDVQGVLKACRRPNVAVWRRIRALEGKIEKGDY